MLAGVLKNVTFSPPPSNWNKDSGLYEQGHKYAKYPYHVHGSGERSSFIVVLKALKSDLDYVCSGGGQGYIVAVHPPHEGPQMYKRYFYVPLQQTVLLSVDPHLMKMVREVRQHDLSERQCYLDGERQLRFYRQYTVHNCRMECLSNFTLAQCGCVKFAMPRTLSNLLIHLPVFNERTITNLF